MARAIARRCGIEKRRDGREGDGRCDGISAGDATSHISSIELDAAMANLPELLQEEIS
ncbi:hypothetical protein [Pseudodonghicola sp.]|jgi:hypothetical protein|uniref:hypothetical protein n=1 Tax=Pseudodonghicola sp. TaxID=1969463 RepID=UPI003A96E85B